MYCCEGEELERWNIERRCWEHRNGHHSSTPDRSRAVKRNRSGRERPFKVLLISKSQVFLLNNDCPQAAMLLLLFCSFQITVCSSVSTVPCASIILVSNTRFCSGRKDRKKRSSCAVTVRMCI